ncbi:hypothetical protein [Cerasicoccus maritimus]|uniref:hypothetical protein n=1 Tax=Cerasicoccus maritimus TaxID=490089 RepID=UPI0028526072|nr:hypothetical protein [Cerasicoccus maritimus]
MFTKFAQLFKRAPKSETPDETKGEADSDEENEDDDRVYARDERDTQSWLGVGLDGVLSERSEAGLAGDIGPLVPDMKARVKDWVKYKRIKVKVLTPRAYNETGYAQVRAWLDANGLDYVECTHAKDLHMVEYWDDHAVQVMSNMGVAVGKSPNQFDVVPQEAGDEIPETPDSANVTK